MDNVPDFLSKPWVDRQDLQDLVEWIQQLLSGGGVEKLGNRFLINGPMQRTKIKARVWRVEDYGSAGSGDLAYCSDKVMYAFQEVDNEICGEFADKAGGITGDGDTVVAFEQNNAVVPDGSIQDLEFHRVWWDADYEPPLKNEEWTFNASTGDEDYIDIDHITGLCIVPGEPPSSGSG